jgi:hypothetical protein
VLNRRVKYQIVVRFGGKKEWLNNVQNVALPTEMTEPFVQVVVHHLPAQQ